MTDTTYIPTNSEIVLAERILNIGHRAMPETVACGNELNAIKDKKGNKGLRQYLAYFKIKRMTAWRLQMVATEVHYHPNLRALTSDPIDTLRKMRADDRAEVQAEHKAILAHIDANIEETEIDGVPWIRFKAGTELTAVDMTNRWDNAKKKNLKPEEDSPPESKDPLERLVQRLTSTVKGRNRRMMIFEAAKTATPELGERLEKTWGLSLRPKEKKASFRDELTDALLHNPNMTMDECRVIGRKYKVKESTVKHVRWDVRDCLFVFKEIAIKHGWQAVIDRLNRFREDPTK